MRHEIGHRPIPEGIALYRELALGWNTILLASGDQPDYAAEVEHFLRVEQLREHSRVLYGTGMHGFVGFRPWSRIEQVNRLRNSGHSITFVVEPDPEVSAELYANGFNVMHFMHAQYTRPQWRPDYEAPVTAWDELVAQETAIKALKTEDKRTSR